jgi:GT2 family glycosyltransferase/glycosyltransferase involved in cell wall biosynthesis
MTTPQTRSDVLRDQATEALRRGEALLTAGDPAAARPWLARAHRILPEEPAVAFTLASALLNLQDTAAVALFAQAATATETREAWLGLAAARWQAGDAPGAVAALGHMLAHHVLPDPPAPMAGLADALAAAAGAPGWCGVAADGPDRVARLVCSHADGVVITVDGHGVAASALPPSGRLSATVAGRALLGSPIDLGRLRRVEGFVAAEQGGVAGWAWLPADPDADPLITVTDAGGATVLLRAEDTGMTAVRPLSRPRRFVVPSALLAAHAGPFRVTGPDGRDLAGSPVDPQAPRRMAAWIARQAARSEPAAGPPQRTEVPPDLAAPAALRGAAAVARSDPRRPVAVVVPVYRDQALTLACLHSVFASVPADTPVIVVDDAGPEPGLAAALDALAAAGRITLLRHATNQGFPAAANAGLRAAFARTPRHDALLLNSDTLLPASRGVSWLERLRAVVHAAPDIGTATPLSNDATILSYPHADRPNPPPDVASVARLDRLAARVNAGVAVEVPTGVGFCLYIRHECAADTGLFRPGLFAQGYGEENDFCVRAGHLGWRHVAAPGVLVGHVGGVSFGAARTALIGRNLAVLERLHPGYRALIEAWQGRVPALDPLAPARLRMDARRWAAARAPAARRRAVVLITHDNGGGVERVIAGRIAALAAAGTRAIVLRPVADPDSDGGSLPGLCRVDDGSGAYPNLVYHLPRDHAALLRLLRADAPVAVELHHRLGHHPLVPALAAALGVPLDLRLHDYASFCPRISLLGPDGRYCGEPDQVAVCEACVADAGSRLGETIGVAALRARSAAEFAVARSVVVPSADMASRMRRHFPALAPTVVKLEDDGPAPRPAACGMPVKVCVIGAIGLEKGFDVLLACARDAAQRALPLSFVLVGRSTDDARLLATGRVFVTGPYREAEAEALVRAQRAHVAFLPSIWPETWGFTLGVAWRAGLAAVVFDIGAMAARVRATGGGQVLPLGLPAPAINNALIAAGGGSLAAGQQDRLWTRQHST